MEFLQKRNLVLPTIVLLIGTAGPALGGVIDFENFTGPSTFAAAGPAQTLTIATGIGTVTVSGGVVLTGATNLPADESSIYGTAGNASNIGVFADPSLVNPITIVFPVAISNVFLDVLNGNTVPVDYTVADNAGHSATFLVAPNLNGGQDQFGFAASGNIVTIAATSGLPTFDFFIDNVHFDEPLPGTVPEPPYEWPVFTMLMVGIGACAARRRRSAAAGR